MNEEQQIVPIFDDRPMPQAIDCERAILSCIMSEADACLDDVIQRLPSKEYFYTAEHRLIYDAVLELRLTVAATSIDYVLIVDALEKKNILERVGGHAYLSFLLNVVPIAYNVSSYLDQAQKAWALRQIILAGTQMVREAYDSPADVWSFLAGAESSLADIQDNHDNGTHTGAEATDLLLEHCLQAKHRKPALFYLPCLDRRFYMPDNSYMVVGARPSVGKTAFALSCCYNAMHAKIPTGLITMEMPHENIMARLVSMESSLPYQVIMEGERVWDDIQRQQVHWAAKKIASLPFFLAGKGRKQNITQIVQTCRDWVRKHAVKMIFIDYFQIIQLQGKGNRYNEFCDISGRILDLKNELKIPIVMLAQLNREFDGDRRRGKEPVRPTRKYLKETGALEQDADLVLLLDRPNLLFSPGQDVIHDYVDGNGGLLDMENRMAVVVDKNRNGSLGTEVCRFTKNIAKVD